MATRLESLTWIASDDSASVDERNAAGIEIDRILAGTQRISAMEKATKWLVLPLILLPFAAALLFGDIDVAFQLKPYTLGLISTWFATLTIMSARYVGWITAAFHGGLCLTFAALAYLSIGMSLAT